ncbi:MAG: hypothetical protein M4579_000191 [Chaenotheca gracillima]|nr:MAG: hypothetical protein M4579_000191 [Chaenotheca gracillima]
MPEVAERTEEGSSGIVSTLRSASQGLLIFFIVQFLFKQFIAPSPASDNPANPASHPIPSFDARPDKINDEATYRKVPLNIVPIWSLDSSIDLSVYVSPSLILPSLKSLPSDAKVLEEKEFKIGNWSDKREIDTTFKVPSDVQKNGTLWAHFLVALSGQPLDPLETAYDSSKAYHFSRPLTQYLSKKKVAKTRKLLGGTNETEDPLEDPQPVGRTVASYYHPNITLSLIPDSGTLMYPTLQPAVLPFVNLESTGARDASGQNSWYYPIVFMNTFWQLRGHMTELNSTVKELPLHISLNNLNNWKFNLIASIDDGMKQNQKKAAAGGPMGAGGDGSEFEEIKRILLDTNVYLLSTTIIVSIFHTIFEGLAFKSDISHWRSKKDNVGVSVRTILANVFMQAVIFLYLIDNSEGTSWVILAGQGFGILLEAWKITKTVNVRVRPAPPGSFIPYRIAFEDKHKLSETEEKTKEYDEIAFKYLYMIAVPLLLAYAVYSILYDTHKSWYSFIITTLVGSVYAYGFLMMVPSLYINYRLKSVAHMPAKAMTYKFLNTFIDDLFAFTIKMPTLHRLATLRDDVIFFVYLYQSYAYRTDYSRINEFGQGPEEADADADVAESKKDEKPAAIEGSGSPKSTGRDQGSEKSARKR